MTTIKQQAEEALRLDPFAKTFVCETQCTKEGCECFLRRTSGNFPCLACCTIKNKQWAIDNKDKAKKYSTAWYQENREYCLNRDKANYLKRKEAQLAAV